MTYYVAGARLRGGYDAFGDVQSTTLPSPAEVAAKITKPLVVAPEIGAAAAGAVVEIASLEVPTFQPVDQISA